ncbi:MAG: restriction endonuclease subunit S [Saprospiraceae bacterium]
MKTNIQRYTAYKDSGVEWLGEIPEHWEVTKLRNIGVFSASGIDKYLKVNESKVKIINFTDIYDSKSMTLDSSFDYMVVTTPESNRIKHLVKMGDLIFLPSSETYEDLGAAALVNEELENTSFSYHVIRLVIKKDLDHSFRKYLTNNAFVLNQFSRHGKGSTRKIIGRGVFKDVQVILPPLSEQNAIAAFLDRKMALIDQAIDIKEKQIELLKERSQILIHKAVTRGLNPDAKLKDSGVEWIGEIPEGWEIVKNRILFQERNEPGNDSLPLLSVSIHTAVSSKEISDEENIRGKIRIEDKSKYKVVEIGDIAFNMMRAWQGAIGSVSTKGMVSPAYVVAKPKRIFDSNYFEFQYRTELFIQQIDKSSKGITDFRKRLYWHEFKQLNTILPTVREQKEISEYIFRLNEVTEKVFNLKEKEVEKLKEYKATLINSAVTGKIKIV